MCCFVRPLARVSGATVVRRSLFDAPAYLLLTRGEPHAMLQIDRTHKSLTTMNHTTLTEAGLQERYDLQALIVRHPDAFFDELGEELILIGEEVQPSDEVDRRIDLLAIDKRGVVSVMELKRGNDRFQLLQALSYAAMIADWTPERLVERMATALKVPVSEAQQQIEGFLDCELSAVNESQRVVLLAEAFDYEVLVTCQWLIDDYGLDVRCYQMKLARHDELTLLSCTRLLPTRELRDQAVRGRRSGRQGSKTPRWPDWDSALEAMANEDERAFFRRQLDNRECEHYLPEGTLYFRHGGKRRWWVQARSQNCYVWQVSRFEGDEAYWTQRLSDTAEVRPVKEGKALRFYLVTAEDFEQFERTVQEAEGQLRFGGSAKPVVEVVEGLEGEIPEGPDISGD